MAVSGLRRPTIIPASKQAQRRELEELVKGADLPAHKGVRRIRSDADECRDWVTLR
jgi:hypothetical protein